MNASIQAYLNQFPRPVQTRLKTLQDLVESMEGDFEATLSYGVIGYRNQRGFLCHFGAYEKHLGFYPGPQVVALFSSELKAYKHAKGSIQFPHHLELPLDLIQRMLKHCAQGLSFR